MTWTAKLIGWNATENTFFAEWSDGSSLFKEGYSIKELSDDNIKQVLRDRVAKLTSADVKPSKLTLTIGVVVDLS